MTEAQKDHVKSNVKAINGRMIEKYVKGQKEHKGNLWEKPGMLRNIEDEIADLCNYVPTLRQQLRDVLNLVKEGRTLEAAQLLEDILSDTCG